MNPNPTEPDTLAETRTRLNPPPGEELCICAHTTGHCGHHQAAA